MQSAGRSFSFLLQHVQHSSELEMENVRLLSHDGQLMQLVCDHALTIVRTVNNSGSTLLPAQARALRTTLLLVGILSSMGCDDTHNVWTHDFIFELIRLSDLLTRRHPDETYPSMQVMTPPFSFEGADVPKVSGAVAPVHELSCIFMQIIYITGNILLFSGCDEHFRKCGGLQWLCSNAQMLRGSENRPEERLILLYQMRRVLECCAYIPKEVFMCIRAFLESYANPAMREQVTNASLSELFSILPHITDDDASYACMVPKLYAPLIEELIHRLRTAFDEFDIQRMEAIGCSFSTISCITKLSPPDVWRSCVKLITPAIEPIIDIYLKRISVSAQKEPSEEEIIEVAAMERAIMFGLLAHEGIIAAGFSESDWVIRMAAKCMLWRIPDKAESLIQGEMLRGMMSVISSPSEGGMGGGGGGGGGHAWIEKTAWPNIMNTMVIALEAVAVQCTHGEEYRRYMEVIFPAIVQQYLRDANRLAEYKNNITMQRRLGSLMTILRAPFPALVAMVDEDSRRTVSTDQFKYTVQPPGMDVDPMFTIQEDDDFEFDGDVGFDEDCVVDDDEHIV